MRRIWRRDTMAERDIMSHSHGRARLLLLVLLHD